MSATTINSSVTKNSKYPRSRAATTRKRTPHFIGNSSSDNIDASATTAAEGGDNTISITGASDQPGCRDSNHNTELSSNIESASRDMSVSDHAAYSNTPSEEQYQTRRRSKSGGSYSTIAGGGFTSEDLLTTSSGGGGIVSDRIQAFARGSLKESIIQPLKDDDLCSRGGERRNIRRNNIHALQDQLFKDSTLERANGQIVIQKKGETRTRSKSYLGLRGETGGGGGGFSRSMEDLDQGGLTNNEDRNSSRTRFADGLSCYGSDLYEGSSFSHRTKQNRFSGSLSSQQQQQQNSRTKDKIFSRRRQQPSNRTNDLRVYHRREQSRSPGGGQEPAFHEREARSCTRTGSLTGPMESAGTLAPPEMFQDDESTTKSKSVTSKMCAAKKGKLCSKSRPSPKIMKRSLPPQSPPHQRFNGSLRGTSRSSNITHQSKRSASVDRLDDAMGSTN